MRKRQRLRFDADSGLFRFSMRPSQWRRLLRLRRLVLTLQRRQDIDSSLPPIVIHTDRSAHLMQYAQMLASEGRKDSEAVAELVRLAGADKHALDIASLGARQGGEYLESYRVNLAHRLLQAALTRSPVTPIDDAERTILLDLDTFADLSALAQWRELTRRQPHLSELVRYCAAQGYTRRHPRRRDIREKLIEYVGPQSNTPDPILKSRVALDAAVEYLLSVRNEGA
jgi:hypothetical protein